MIGFCMAIINRKRKIQLVCNFWRDYFVNVYSVHFLFGELTIRVWLRRNDEGALTLLRLQSFLAVAYGEGGHVSRTLALCPRLTHLA